jgi:hypothetical protein
MKIRYLLSVPVLALAVGCTSKQTVASKEAPRSVASSTKGTGDVDSSNGKNLQCDPTIKEYLELLRKDKQLSKQFDHIRLSQLEGEEKKLENPEKFDCDEVQVSVLEGVSTYHSNQSVLLISHSFNSNRSSNVAHARKTVLSVVERYCLNGGIDGDGPTGCQPLRFIRFVNPQKLMEL